jgi:hypothetical protein
MRKLSAAALTGLLLCGGAAPATAPAAAQAAPALHHTSQQLGEDWAGELLYQADMEAAPNVIVAFTNESNCGASISANGAGGCTYTLEDGSYYVTISPELVGTIPGKHVFFHELAHTLGISDECEAERYAAQFDDVDVWSYPECAPMAEDAS